MNEYIFIEGDRITGCHTNIKMIRKWKKEIEKKKKINCTIARVMGRLII